MKIIPRVVDNFLVLTCGPKNYRHDQKATHEEKIVPRYKTARWRFGNFAAGVGKSMVVISSGGSVTDAWAKDFNALGSDFHRAVAGVSEPRS